MKSARLIKKATLQQPPVPPQTSATKVAVRNNAVQVVQSWMKEQRASQPYQARQMFAALFAQTPS